MKSTRENWARSTWTAKSQRLTPHKGQQSTQQKVNDQPQSKSTKDDVNNWQMTSVGELARANVVDDVS